MDAEQDVIYANRETIERQQQANRPRKAHRPPGVGQETNDVFVENNNPNQDAYDDVVEKQNVMVNKRKGRYQANYGANRPLPEPQEEERYEPLNVSTLPQHRPMSTVQSGYEVSSVSQAPAKHNRISSSSKPLISERGENLGTTNAQFDEYDDVAKHVSPPPRKGKEKLPKEKKVERKQAECIELRDLKVDGIQGDTGSDSRTQNGTIPIFLGVAALLIALAALIIAVLLSLGVIKPEKCNCSDMERHLQQQIDQLKEKQEKEAVQSSPIYRPTPSAPMATQTTLHGVLSTVTAMTSLASSSPSTSHVTLIRTNWTVGFNESVLFATVSNTASISSTAVG